MCFKWEALQKSPEARKRSLDLQIYCDAVPDFKMASKWSTINRGVYWSYTTTLYSDTIDPFFRNKASTLSQNGQYVGTFYFVHIVCPFSLFCPYRLSMDNTYIHFSQNPNYCLSKIWRFQTFLSWFFTPLFLTFFHGKGTFCARGNFSKRSPSIKESKKEKEKNLKIRKKSSNRPEKRSRRHLFDLIVSLRDPFFARFEIFILNQIQPLKISFSFLILFLFSSLLYVHFHTKTNLLFYPSKSPKPKQN